MVWRSHVCGRVCCVYVWLRPSRTVSDCVPIIWTYMTWCGRSLYSYMWLLALMCICLCLCERNTYQLKWLCVCLRERELLWSGKLLVTKSTIVLVHIRGAVSMLSVLLLLLWSYLSWRCCEEEVNIKRLRANGEGLFWLYFWLFTTLGIKSVLFYFVFRHNDIHPSVRIGSSWYFVIFTRETRVFMFCCRTSEENYTHFSVASIYLIHWV